MVIHCVQDKSRPILFPLASSSFNPARAGSYDRGREVRFSWCPEQQASHERERCACSSTEYGDRRGRDDDFIEHQLAHAVKDPHGRAYNWTTHLEERRKMMQAWADYLDRLNLPSDLGKATGNSQIAGRVVGNAEVTYGE